jgi:hypothetical protein
MRIGYTRTRPSRGLHSRYFGGVAIVASAVEVVLAAEDEVVPGVRLRVFFGGVDGGDAGEDLEVGNYGREVIDDQGHCEEKGRA